MFKFLSFDFWTLRLILWPIKFFLRIVVKPEGFNREQFLSSLQGKDVAFVLARSYLLDTFVINQVLKRHNLPQLKTELVPNSTHKYTICALRPTPGIIWDEQVDPFVTLIDEMQKYDVRLKNGTMTLVPVSIFWGKGAERSKPSILARIFFPEDDKANAIQKILMLFLHSTNIHVHFGQPHALQPSDDAQYAKKLKRQLQIDFNREKTSTIGPELYDQDTIHQWILSSKETYQFISSLGDSFSKNKRKAAFYLKEIAARYSYSAVRGYELLLDFLWTQIFKGIRIRNFERIENIARSGQILWMPCHRSHLDYLLLSYVLLKKGIVVPHIAAGVNLSFFPAGFFLRRGGAFFLRRSFSGNRLYAYVFSKYVDFLMHNSFPIEFFHEGGRSRIGKLLAPKTGLTSIVTQSIIQRKAENTYVLPVYFSYDKVMESESYAKELAGAKKQNESLWQLLKAFKHLFSNYGRVDVSFGHPIHFGKVWNDFFSSYQTVSYYSPLPFHLRDLDEPIEARDARIQAFVKYFAHRVNQGINAAVAPSSGALLASTLLVLNQDKFTKAELNQNLLDLTKLLSLIGKGIGWNLELNTDADADFNLRKQESPGTLGASPVQPTNSGILPIAPTETTESLCLESLENALKWGVLAVDPTTLEIRLQREKEVTLWWYRGNVFHVLAMAGIVARLLIQKQDWQQSQLETKLTAVRTVWRDELYWPDELSSSVLLRASLNALSELKYIDVINDEMIQIQSPEKLEQIAQLIEPEIETYGLQLATALNCVETVGHFERSELLKTAKLAHRAGFLRGEATYPAYLSEVYGARTFDALQRVGIFILKEQNCYELAFTELTSVHDFFALTRWEALTKEF